MTAHQSTVRRRRPRELLLLLARPAVGHEPAE